MPDKKVHDPHALKELLRERESLKRLESFPYSETLSSVMVSPVVTSTPDELLSDLAKKMAVNRVSSVVVVDKNEEIRGIITERDILTKVVAVGCESIKTLKASDIMTPNPVTLEPEDTIYYALSVLSKRGIKHLPLVRENKIAGIVTLRQLLKLRHPEPLSLITNIRDAETAEQLGKLRKQIPSIAAQKLSLGISAYDIVTMITLINADIHRRVLELVFQNCGKPPVEFCIFVTGSHGRMENLLTPDQDHAMVINGEDGYYENQDYFIELTRTFSDYLNMAGFDYCPGYIMSVNPIWRKPLTEWKSQLWYWFNRQVSELGRYITILFDSRFLTGEKYLFNELMEFAYELLHNHHEALLLLKEEESSHKAPIGFLGRFITEKKGSHKGELDIKRSGLIFLVEGIRILALLHGVKETSTIGRIKQLVEQGKLHRDDGMFFESAYQVLLHYVLKIQVERALKGEEIDTYIRPEDLTHYEQDMLRNAFRAISALQDIISSEFGELVI